MASAEVAATPSMGDAMCGQCWTWAWSGPGAKIRVGLRKMRPGNTYPIYKADAGRLNLGQIDFTPGTQDGAKEGCETRAGARIGG